MTDLLIVGAGPAGMSAALEAVKHGQQPLVVDNRPEPGGNIYAWCNRNSGRPTLLRHLGTDYAFGGKLVAAFLEEVSNGRIKYQSMSRLWRLDLAGEFAVTGPSGTTVDKAESVVLATGAMERPMPLPGWTLPGVMGVGAAQLLIKSGGELPDGPVTIVGAGPLALLFADQLHRLGYRLTAFVEPAGANRLWSSQKYWSFALRSPETAAKGIALLARRRLSRVPVFQGAREIKIVGDNAAVALSFYAQTNYEIPTRTVLLHDGVVPNLNVLVGSGLNIKFSVPQRTWHAAPSEKLKVAGDAGGILGAKAAYLSGRMAVLETLGKHVPKDLLRRLEREKSFRRFLDTAFPPIQTAHNVSDQTIICRCEAITAGEIRAKTGFVDGDPNRLKRYLRTGMGPCQGRMCGHSVASIMADELGLSEGDIGYPRIRSPFLPATFGSLADSG